MARMPRPWFRKGTGVWMATIDNKQVPLGVRDPADESAAWEALRRLVKAGVAEALAPASNVKHGVLAELVAQWLGVKRPDVNAATLKGYDKYLKWLTKHFGQLSAAGLDLAAVRARAAAEEWSDTHRANTLWTVNAFLLWCGRSDKIPLPPRDSRGAETVISDELHRRVLAETAGDFRALCNFLWLTGCRPGEATSLTCEQVNWEAKTVVLKKHKTRHKGKTRTLHLSAAAVEVLADQALKYDATGYLFRGLRGRPFSLQAMTMRFERLSDKLGKKVTSYCYRHSFATRALAAGESDAVVAALLGHSSTQMIHKHYSHLSAEGRALREAAERVNQRAG